MKAVSIRLIGLLILLFIGVFFLFIGLFSFNFISPLISKKVEQNKLLLNGSEAVEKWKSIKLPIYMKYYFFNVKNSEEVIKGENPILEEKGPYVFREVFKYEIDNWNDDETLITYRKRKFYHFEPELTNGSLDDNITIINLPLFSLATKILKGGLFGSTMLINSAIRKTGAKAFLTRTVDELLFSGYTEELFDQFSSVLSKLSSDIPKDGKFALMKGRNGSDDGEWTVFTGKNNIKNFAQIKTWNRMESISCWNGSNCADIKGTDGTMYHPNISPDERLFLFSPDVNRSVYLVYEEDVRVHKLNAYKFVIPSTVFRAPYKEKENECFCVNQKEDLIDIGEQFCSLDGVIDMSKCKKGVPLVISLPHFYGGDKLLFSGISGLNPTKAKHENFAFVDPVTGIVLSAGRRLQVSYSINSKTYKGLKALKNIKDVILPVIWFEETFLVTETLADKLWSLVHKKILTVKHYLMISVIVGLIIIATVFLTVVCIYVRNNFMNNKETKKNDTKAEYSYSNLKKGLDTQQTTEQI